MWGSGLMSSGMVLRILVLSVQVEPVIFEHGCTQGLARGSNISSYITGGGDLVSVPISFSDLLQLIIINYHMLAKSCVNTHYNFSCAMKQQV